MASKKEKKVIEVTVDQVLGLVAEEKSLNITEASLNDNFCNYTYEIIKGVGSGDKHGVKGSGIIKDDMLDAFQRFNVHLAAIDDAFKLSGIEVENIDEYHNHELTSHYHVTGFKIKGGAENESIVLVGSKFVGTAGGRIELATFRIPMDNLSSYKWYNELKAEADNARNEVELYREGKYTAVEEDEESPKKKKNPRQLTIGDEITKSQESSISDDFVPSTEVDTEFENAKA